jgi:neutral ceramidase
MKKLKILIPLFVLFFSGYILSAQGIKPGELKAGAAKVSITPPAYMFPTGGSRDFIGVHDSIYVRSIIIDNGITKAALLSLELAGAPTDEKFYEDIALGLNIKPENLFVSATHSHSTQGIDSYTGDNTAKYYEIVKNATIKSLKEANSKLKPARVGYETGKAYVNTNRDEKIGEGFHMGYNPEGPSDKTVTAVTFTSLSGEPIAVYTNYAVHSVVMFRAKTKDGHAELSGDLPGATSRYIENHFKDIVAVYSVGAAGDQNPLFMATYNQDAPDVFDEGPGGYAILDVLSRRLGEEFVRVINSTKNTSSMVNIWGKKTIVTSPGRQRKYPPAPNEVGSGYRAPAVIEMIDGAPVNIQLHLLMINDIAIAGVSGDFYTEIGMNIKKESPFDRTLIVGKMPEYSKIVNCAGYIPTDKAYLLASEKALSNPLKPGYAEPAVIKAYNEMMKEYISLKK